MSSSPMPHSKQAQLEQRVQSPVQDHLDRKRPLRLSSATFGRSPLSYEDMLLPSLIGLVLASGWSFLEPAGIGSVRHGDMEWIVLSAIIQHLRDGQGIRHRQHGFRKGRSYLTNLISFYDQVTCIVDEGKAVDVSI
ncbi:hypothetical protein BTVI_39715 [Pitangus sulphuratus]|nr:hypothetical protein BTVI_39715 [Pitangus sulphuratus]